jgi:orotate phosphoribosyltransferase
MKEYKKKLAITLAETGALFFDNDLILKDGRPTPYFVNFGMFRKGGSSMKLGSFFADMIVDRGFVEKTDIILGPSYKGSSIAVATSIALYANHGYDLFFEYDRKETKTHGEASKSPSILVNRTLFDGCRIFIVDDVASTMATKYELIDRLNEEIKTSDISIDILGVGIAVDREQTTAVYDDSGNVVPNVKGKDTISNFIKKTGIQVYSIAGIREIADYLYKEKVPVLINGEYKPIDQTTKAGFDNYMRTYGN